jgi:hypothetical protein
METNGLRKVTAGAAALLLALAATAAADEVRLKSGRTVEGIARREPGKVIVESRLGTLTFLADEVQEIVPGRTPMHEFTEREAALGPSPKAQDVYELALWAQDRGLVRYVHPLLERTVHLDPNFAPARRLLDQIQIGGRWMTRSERDALAAAAATRAESKSAGQTRRAAPTRPRPEMDPGYVYFGIPPYQAPRGSQNWGCCGYAFPIFRGVVVP